MTSITRPVTRISVPVPGTFDDAVVAFESAVPMLDQAGLAALVHKSADWAELTEWTQARAPHGFLIYWKNDVRPLMRVAGDDTQAIAYLMGNHVTVETMFRHDPRVMIYAPLRVELSQSGDDSVLFTTDVPSDQFGAFGIPAVSETGRALDAELKQLLIFLGAAPPEELG